MDGQTDKNRQTIAVTLRLRFAVRVNNIIIDYNWDKTGTLLAAVL